MFFKSLELQGFKSFPDRVKLEFEQGLTAVVGPNGSGKSNIGDAIRWVLGEQSTKLLRGNRMEDVIFSGTKRRKPSGFAAVTIQLDNQTGLFGESYGETIAITRKLYRSGESVYQINGKAVRLKDVQELLMDTGMGRDGYAIIGRDALRKLSVHAAPIAGSCLKRQRVFLSFAINGKKPSEIYRLHRKI